MIVSRFRSMGLAAGAAASVLSCYMVSLRVARERGEVERLQQRIADTRHDIRELGTELGTRGRLRQLERWNADVLALSTPKAAQFLSGEVELARYEVAPPAAAAPGDAAPARVVQAVVQARPALPAPPPRVVTATYAAPPPTPAQALLHAANYVAPVRGGASRDEVRIALLDSDVLGEIGHAAAGEAKRARKVKQVADDQ